jgi:hypothetical protein
MILISIIEILLVALVIVGLFSEDKIADFEQRLFMKLKRRIKEGKYGKGKR